MYINKNNNEKKHNDNNRGCTKSVIWKVMPWNDVEKMIPL